MEVTCTRCHQAVPVDSCYCPTCGLPQIVYSSEDGSVPAPGDSSTGTLRDASAVEWKPALRSVILLAVPAGLLSCGQLPSAFFSFFWVAIASAWAVTLYVRKQTPAWITTGAGARIGLVTGLLAGWLAFAASGVALYSMRFFFGQGKEYDKAYEASLVMVTQWIQSMSPDPQVSAEMKANLAWSLSTEGRAGSALASMLLLQFAFLVFAAAGGALGARLTARSRRPSV